MRIGSLVNRFSFDGFFRAWFLLIQPLGWAACFARFGDYIPSDEPCKPEEDHSVCCADQWACLENGLCKSTNTSFNVAKNVYALGTCTDSKWETKKCPKLCDGNDGINPCGDEEFCCGNCTCTNSTAMITIPGSHLPFTTIGVLASTSTASSLISFRTTPSTSSSSNSNSNKGLKIGLGVGISVSVILICILAALIFWRERRWKSRVEDIQGNPHAPKEFSDNPVAVNDPVAVKNPVALDNPATPDKPLALHQELPSNGFSHELNSHIIAIPMQELSTVR